MAADGLSEMGTMEPIWHRRVALAFVSLRSQSKCHDTTLPAIINAGFATAPLREKSPWIRAGFAAAVACDFSNAHASRSL